MIPKPAPRRRKGKTARQRVEELQSLYVRYRDGWVCDIHKRIRQKGILNAPRCGGHLQACHLINRKDSNAHKYNLQNIRAGCKGINAWAHYHEEEWKELWQKLYPEVVPLLETSKVLVQRKESDFLRMEYEAQWILLPLVMPAAEYRSLKELDFNTKKFLKSKKK